MKLKIFLLLILGSFNIGVHGQSYNSQGQLLWEIKGPNSISYLWGTIHTNDKRVFNFPDSVYYALTQSKNIALEINVFDIFLDKDPRKYENEVTLDSQGNLYTSVNYPSESFYGNEDGMPQFMDAYFQQFAELSNLGVFALESIDDQTNSLREFPFYADPSADSEFGYSEKSLIDFYLDGDIEKIDQFIRMELASNKEAYHQIIRDRNEKMLVKMDSLIKINSTFFGVGAAHLYGTSGLVALLKNKGYALRPLSLLSQSFDSDFEKAVKQKNSFVYKGHEKEGLQIKFPGNPKIIEDTMVGEFRLEYKELGQGNAYFVEIIEKDTSLSLLEYAEIYIASPPKSPYKYGAFDDGTEYVQGLTDEYPEGLKWVRIIMNDKIVVISKAYGGNKFMNSNRPFLFFNNVFLED